MKLFQNLLEGWQEIFDESAVIAGGSVRDFKAGNVNMKDIDLFTTTDEATILDRAEELGWETKPYQQEEAVVEDYKHKIIKTRLVGCFMRNTVDIVVTNQPLTLDIVRQYPIWAQRAMYTLEHGLVTTPEFDDDILNKRFTVAKNTPAIVAKAKGWQQRRGYHDWPVRCVLNHWWEKDANLRFETLETHESKKVPPIRLGDTMYVNWLPDVGVVAAAHRVELNRIRGELAALAAQRRNAEDMFRVMVEAAEEEVPL